MKDEEIYCPECAWNTLKKIENKDLFYCCREECNWTGSSQSIPKENK